MEESLINPPFLFPRGHAIASTFATISRLLTLNPIICLLKPLYYMLIVTLKVSPSCSLSGSLCELYIILQISQYAVAKLVRDLPNRKRSEGNSLKEQTLESTNKKNGVGNILK